MTLTFEGTTYRIRFHHQHEPDESYLLTRCVPINAGGTKDGKVRAITTCWLESQTTNGDWIPVSSRKGQAFCSLSDNFCRETGRRLALRRRLKYFSRHSPIRQHIWNTYLSRPRGKK